ncbi:hypothetical protein PoB_004339500 [Plakobranchus ocellatus]|uniref:Uncharacterized protein n=1 Tax=Plakobranchus ocellatus TaxID=259542 RepID=A0AAV4BCT7_9GAST|nr:hypothetical protein PoB_004339500 [Plakobranchus ocellatus]
MKDKKKEKDVEEELYEEMEEEKTKKKYGEEEEEEKHEETEKERQMCFAISYRRTLVIIGVKHLARRSVEILSYGFSVRTPPVSPTAQRLEDQMFLFLCLTLPYAICYLRLFIKLYISF